MIDPSVVEIRAYRDGDREALVALWDDCGLTRSWNDPDQDLALMASSTENAAVFVGEHEGRLVASCFVGHDGHRGWLYYLAIAPAVQRGGLGGRIVRHCEAWLDARGVAKCQVMIRETNPGGQALLPAHRLRAEPLPPDAALAARSRRAKGSPRRTQGRPAPLHDHLSGDDRAP